MTTEAKGSLSLPIAATGVPTFYRRVSALGFGLVALGSLVALVWALAGGNAAEALAFTLPIIVIGLAVASAVWRWGRGALVAAVVVSLLLLGLVLPFSLFSLGHPESGADFIPVVLTAAGAGLGLVGSLAGLIQWRRGTVRANASRTEQLVLGGVLGAVALAVVLSLVLTLTGRTVVAAELKTGALSMRIKGFAYSPGLLKADTGQAVRILVRNDDSTLHTFTLPAAGVDVSVAPGSEKIVEFQAPEGGRYQWYCIPHSSANGATRSGMVGELVIGQE